MAFYGKDQADSTQDQYEKILDDTDYLVDRFLNNLNTYIKDFPNGVQVSLLLNSDWDGANVPHGDDYQGELLKRAFENAWPEKVLRNAAETVMREPWPVLRSSAGVAPHAAREPAVASASTAARIRGATRECICPSCHEGE